MRHRACRPSSGPPACVPRWLRDSRRKSPLPQPRQLSEFTSVLAAYAQGQENPGVLRTEGKLLQPFESAFFRDVAFVNCLMLD